MWKINCFCHAITIVEGLFCVVAAAFVAAAVNAYLPNEFTGENVCLFAYVEYK